jgi:hypothetical protein
MINLAQLYMIELILIKKVLFVNCSFRKKFTPQKINKHRTSVKLQRIIAFLALKSILESSENPMLWQVATNEEVFEFLALLIRTQARRSPKKFTLWAEDRDDYGLNSEADSYRSYMKKLKKKPPFDQSTASQFGVHPGWHIYYLGKPFIPYKYRARGAEVPSITPDFKTLLNLMKN